MGYEWIFFDLDGTLTDSAPGITAAIAYAFEKLGIPPESREALRRFVGPPLVEAFQRDKGMDAATAQRGLQLFREYYTERGILENSPYPGISAVLKKLRDAGKKLAVATSKPEVHARRVLHNYALEDYFHMICGSTLDESRVHKEEVISFLLDQLNRPAPEQIVMVGDRCHDVKGAALFGIQTIGVLYGYGSKEELLQAGAIALAETPADLLKLLI